MNDSIKPQPGDMVVLTAVPLGLLDGLPQEDKHAIIATVGKPVLLVGYDDDGRAEIFFSVWVPPAFVTLFPETQK
jgi:hypothetical protein